MELNLELNENKSNEENKKDIDDDKNDLKREMFEFKYIIGKGGFGKVWKVQYKKTKEYFALKEMSKRKILDKKSEKSINSERKFLSMLNHPFMVNMHYAFQDNDNLYLVMDMLHGGDLRYHCSRYRTFSEEQTRFFIACIIYSLEYIHSNNVIHRDIKPENLVLDKEGYVRITDFGVAKENMMDNSSETSGTPGYMSPEVMKGENHSFPVDFFAVGVIGYEFLIGNRPYEGKNRKEIKEKMFGEKVEIKGDKIKKGWSNEGVDFINKLLEIDKNKRLGAKNGALELKQHPWLKFYPWEELEKKTLPAPFVPEQIDNFDKNYCESEEKISEDTKIRYEEIYSSTEYINAFVDFYYNKEKPKYQRRQIKTKRIVITGSGSKEEKKEINNKNDNNKIIEKKELFDDKNKEKIIKQTFDTKVEKSENKIELKTENKRSTVNSNSNNFTKLIVSNVNRKRIRGDSHLKNYIKNLNKNNIEKSKSINHNLFNIKRKDKIFRNNFQKGNNSILFFQSKNSSNFRNKNDFLVNGQFPKKIIEKSNSQSPARKFLFNDSSRTNLVLKNADNKSYKKIKSQKKSNSFRVNFVKNINGYGEKINFKNRLSNNNKGIKYNGNINNNTNNFDMKFIHKIIFSNLNKDNTINKKTPLVGNNSLSYNSSDNLNSNQKNVYIKKLYNTNNYYIIKNNENFPKTKINNSGFQKSISKFRLSLNNNKNILYYSYLNNANINTSLKNLGRTNSVSDCLNILSKLNNVDKNKIITNNYDKNFYRNINSNSQSKKKLNYFKNK